MSDLVAGVHALVTENEQGIALDQRVREIHATAKAIMMYATRIATTREVQVKPEKG